jgi:transcriptional regulator with XRE-family HTH domain
VTDPDEQRKPINWGTEIKKLREGQNMAQRRLAKLAGVDRASLRRFEEGDSRGNIDLVERVAEVLGYEFELMHRGYPGGFSMPPAVPQLVAPEGEGRPNTLLGVIPEPQRGS